MGSKKMILSALILMLFAGMLSGCQQGIGTTEPSAASDGNTIYVFYKNSQGTGAESIGYSLTSEGDAAIRDLFNILQNGQFGDGSSAVPSGVELEQSAWQEHSLAIYLTGDYPEAGTVEEVLCRYAIAETMFQLPDVKGVSFYVDNEPLRGSDGLEVGTMTEDSFLTDVSVLSGEEKTVIQKIYYTLADGSSLKACDTEITVNGKNSEERQIVEKLMEAPSGESASGCTAVLPEETEILTVSVHEGICYLNLNSGFAEAESDISRKLQIYAIVNSLTELEEVDSVQLMINGTTDYDLGEEISLAAPLEADMAYVTQ